MTEQEMEKATVHLMESREAIRFVVDRMPEMGWQGRVTIVILRVLAYWLDADYTNLGG